MRQNSSKKIFIALSLVVSLTAVNRLTGQWIKATAAGVIKKPFLPAYRHLGQWRRQTVSWFKTDEILSANQQLVLENQLLKKDNLGLKDLERENNLLRQELGVARRRQWQVEIAQIFQITTDGPFRTALINKGKKEGVKSGQAVVFSGNLLLGVVKEVYDHEALIYLTTDPRLVLNVKTVDSAVAGRTKGALVGGLILELITNQEEIKEGEELITSGLDGLPSLLRVGQVEGVHSESGALFKTITVEPEFGDLLLDNIFVLKE